MIRTQKEKANPEGLALFAWLGYLDSNQGITVSETVVLPLDYIPRASKKYNDGIVICQTFSYFFDKKPKYCHIREKWN